MMHSRLAFSLATLLAISATVLASTPTAVTNFGAGKQIWLTAGSFDSATPQFTNDSLPDTLSGQSYTFAEESPAGSQQPWYAEYTLSASAVGGNLSGTWYFWGRSTQASEGLDRYADSDWLFVKNDSTDGSGASWYDSALSTAGESDKIFNNMGPYTGYAYGAWGWMSNVSSVLVPVSKQFNAENDTITFRIYEREGGAANAHIDLICWTNDANYVPTDADFATPPEPPVHPGDFNKDGKVTDADYTAWADNYGLPVPPGLADPNGDGMFTDGDYTAWAENYGFGVTGVVPEPASLTLLGLGLLGLIRRR